MYAFVLYIPSAALQTIDRLPLSLYEIVLPVQVVSSPFQPLDRYPVFLIIQPARNSSPLMVRYCREFPLGIRSLSVRVLYDQI